MEIKCPVLVAKILNVLVEGNVLWKMKILNLEKTK
jgi:hypothetical protein